MTDELDFNSLVQMAPPEQKNAPTAAPASGGMDFNSMVQTAGPEASQPSVTGGKDFAKSVGSGAMNIPIQAVGLPGDVQSLARAGGQSAFESLMGVPNAVQDWWSGSDTPEAKERKKALDERIAAGRKVEEGRTRLTLPTSHDISQAVSPTIEQTVGLSPEYKPQTKTGEYAKTITEFAGPSMLGKGRAAVKAGEAILGGGASQLAGDIAKEQGLSPAVQTGAQIVGALLGSYGGGRGASTLQDIIAPSAGATEKAVENIATARRERPQATLSDAEVQQAIREGRPIGAFDLLGEKASGILTSGTASEGGRSAALEIDNFIKQRNQDTFNRVDAGLDAITGRKIDAGQTALDLKAQAKIDNKANFDSALLSPKAQNVENQTLVDLAARPLAQPAISAAYKAFDNNYEPTLKFWHEVKMNLDDQVNKAFKDGDNTLGKNLKEIRDQLRSDLQKTVPEYSQALNVSSGFFKADNALEAGQNYAKNLDAFDRAKAKAAFDALDPEAKKLFQDGMITQFKVNAARSGATHSLVSTLDKRSVRDKISDVFTPDQAKQIDAMLTAENVMRNHNAINLIDQSKKPNPFMPNLADVGAAGTAVAAGVASSPFTLAASGLAGTVYGSHVLLNVAERRVAGEVNRLLSQTVMGGPESQKAILELSALAAKNPAAGSLMDKIETAGTKAAKAAYAANSDERKQRKAGGRVMRDAITLAQDAIRTRKAIGGKTEQMLSMPDDAIVSALHTAKKTLGGSI
jgi:hypothetical protein